MQINKEKMKRLLDRAIEHELKYRKIPNYEEATKRITENDYMAFFDVLEAHHMANNIMEDYLYNMYHYVRGIILLSYLDGELSTPEVLANTIDILNYGSFDHDEILAMSWELFDKIMGKDYLKDHEFELLSDKHKRLFKEKRFVLSKDENFNFTLREL